MNIIFFDIDGVLNSYNTSMGIDEKTLDRLINLAKSTNSKLVMSSSWKDVLIHPEIYSEPDRKFVENLIDDLGDLFIGHTPDVDEDNRELEIQGWLEEHPEVDNFVILDDQPFNFQEMFESQFVKTTGLNGIGLSEENVKEASKILDCIF